MSAETSHRFKLCFYNKKARDEYLALDGSVKALLRPGLAKLQERADEIGTPLHGELAGCRKLKYRKDGWRIVYRVTKDAVELIEIAEIIATGKRERSKVCSVAEKRLAREEEDPIS